MGGNPLPSSSPIDSEYVTQFEMVQNCVVGTGVGGSSVLGGGEYVHEPCSHHPETPLGLLHPPKVEGLQGLRLHIYGCVCVI